MPNKPRKGRNSNYEVGYGKPPEGSKFKRGKPSPNPAGRPRGSRSIGAVVERTLGRDVDMVVNGRRKRVPATEAILLNFLKRALGNDHKAGLDLIRLGQLFEPAGQSGHADQPDQQTAADKEEVRRYVDAICIAEGMIALGAFEFTAEGGIKVCRWFFEIALANRPDDITEHAVWSLRSRYVSGMPNPIGKEEPN